MKILFPRTHLFFLELTFPSCNVECFASRSVGGGGFVIGPIRGGDMRFVKQDLSAKPARKVK